MIVNLLQNANRNGWKVYVVTSRGTEREYVGNLAIGLDEILSYAINPLFVREIQLNKERYFGPQERQVYYIDGEFILKKDENLIIPPKWKEQNWTSVIKMMQIEDIKEKNRNVPWTNFYFFDDASYHLSAWRYWYSSVNPPMKQMKFFGGQGHCVFSDYGYRDLCRCGLITTKVCTSFKRIKGCDPQGKFKKLY